jgi:NADPH-dependent sulfite reductase flavoprotein alpha-component
MELFNLFKSKNKNELLILYGTKSGNAKLIAEQTQKYFDKYGIKSVCKNISGFDPMKLNETQKLLVVVSTHGEGEPPPAAERFFKVCLSDEMTKLPQLNYSICALGDSSYEEFCRAGKELDRRFTELGAKAFHPRKDCDLEFSQDAVQWIKQTAEALISKAEKPVEVENFKPGFETGETYSARITERILLTKGDEVAPVYHLTLDTGDSEFQYNIGDSVEIKPENPAWLAEALTQKLVNGETAKTETAGIKKRLANDLEITSLSGKTVHDYANLTNNGALNDLLQTPENLKKYTEKANLLDLLTDYPAKTDIAGFLNILPKIKGRKYSIASSQKSFQNEVHLTIKTIRYNYQGNLHEGSASVYANEFLPVNSKVAFKLCPNVSFQLPKSIETPIIMIGVSTGIAPFRAILQERETMQLIGNTWLIWGNKFREKDFLYRDEILNFEKKGIIERLDTTFSRDNGTFKYISDILLSKREDIKKWLIQGAHIYVCGSLKMAQQVKITLREICNGNHTSQLSFDEIIKEQRYHEEAY